ncbi:MAG: alpha/beta hydrolase [Deltaproteobacteria bacterium]|nr:alpha/beta hydrolase [Deltaproteobacteria bacterium]
MLRRIFGTRRRRLLALLLLGIVALPFGMHRLQRFLTYPAYLTRGLDRSLADVARLERWRLDTDEGVVEALYLRAEDASAEHPAPAVIFLHGNGEVVEQWVEPLEGYRRLGVSVLIPEYRGYGGSAGHPSEDAIVADAVAFRDRLAALPEVDAERIVYHGRSLGGGVAGALAARRPPAALVLMSTFSSLDEMASRYLVPRFVAKALLGDHYRTLDVVRERRFPTLVIHGDRDGVVPYAQGQALAEAADARLVTYRAGHNDCPPDWPVLFLELQRFLRQAGVLPGELGVEEEPP